MVYCFCQSEFPSIQSLSTYYNFFFTRLIIVSIYLNIVVIPWLRIILQSKALSTLIRFQTKTELFCSVFKKICVHTYRFRPSTLQRRIRFENAFIPSVRMLKWTRRMRISIYRPEKLARNWSHIVASVRHFWYSRSSDMAPGRVYFDDVTVFR